MRQLHLAELRDSQSAWLGICVAFTATNFALALASLTLVTGVTAVQSGALNYWKSAGFTFVPGLNLFFCAIVGALVIGAATSLVVDSRRGSLARLALTGATPRQVVSTIMSQLTVVSLACSVVGDALALVAFEPTLRYLANDPSEPLAVPPAIYAAWPVLLANLFAVGLALLGGLRQARQASRIPPVEALRQATGDRDERMTRGRWVSSGLLLLIVVGAYGAIPALTPSAPRRRSATSSCLAWSSSFSVRPCSRGSPRWWSGRSPAGGRGWCRPSTRAGTWPAARR